MLVQGVPSGLQLPDTLRAICKGHWEAYVVVLGEEVSIKWFVSTRKCDLIAFPPRSSSKILQHLKWGLFHCDTEQSIYENTLEQCVSTARSKGWI